MASPLGERRHQPQPAGVEHEALLRGAVARDRDLAGQMRASERDVDDVVAGIQPQRRAGLAMRRNERAACRRGPACRGRRATRGPARYSGRPGSAGRRARSGRRPRPPGAAFASDAERGHDRRVGRHQDRCRAGRLGRCRRRRIGLGLPGAARPAAAEPRSAMPPATPTAQPVHTAMASGGLRRSTMACASLSRIDCDARRSLQQNQGVAICPVNGRRGAVPTRRLLVGGQLENLRFARPQLDGALVALVARLRRTL